MNDEIFLIDSNSLITSHLAYYPFDFAPSFWTQMEKHIKDGRIAILDKVKNEIVAGNDNLKDWMENLTIKLYIDHKEQNIINKYSEVLESIRNNPCYKPEALQEWSRLSVADPWLVATAAVNGYTIITFERKNNGLNPHNPSKSVKIPDVGLEFSIKIDNLYYMMRVLKFRL